MFRVIPYITSQWFELIPSVRLGITEIDEDDYSGTCYYSVISWMFFGVIIELVVSSE